MRLPSNFDVQALHDLVAGLHMPYYDTGGPERCIEMMLAAVADGRIGFVPIGADCRDDWYAQAAASLASLRAEMYCVASEAWAAAWPRAGDPARALMPSQREDRMEVVTTVAVDRDGNQATTVKMIERFHDGLRVGAVRRLSDTPMLSGITDGDMLRLFEAGRFA